jgi:hypothetical protein
MRDMDGPRRIDVGFQDSLPVLAVRRVSLELACPPTATPMTPLASAESTLSPFGMLTWLPMHKESPCPDLRRCEAPAPWPQSRSVPSGGTRSADLQNNKAVLLPAAPLPAAELCSAPMGVSAAASWKCQPLRLPTVPPSEGSQTGSSPPSRPRPNLPQLPDLFRLQRCK